MRNKMMVLGVLMFAVGRFASGAEMCAAMGGASGDQPEISFSGVVMDTTNASRYTYVQINTGKETLWAAGPVFDVKVGDRVTVEGGMLARNFKSKVLNRKFDDLYLAASISQAGSAAAPGATGAMRLPEGHPSVTGHGKPAPDAAMPRIEKPEGGKTVAEIWAGKDGLAGKTVTVRAKVVKVTPKIMKLNWLHLRDGSGTEGSNDLVVTTKAEVHAGDIVTVRGTLGTNRDFGSGYRYDVILEEATLLP